MRGGIDNNEFGDWELDRYLNLVDEFGHMIIGVGPDGENPPFFYTVGLSTQDDYGYELAVSGLPVEIGPPLLDGLAAIIKQRGIIPAEGLLVEGDGTPLRLHRADLDRPFVKISQYTGLPSPVWQAVWPDVGGRYPGEPGCSLTSRDQADFALSFDSPLSP